MLPTWGGDFGSGWTGRSLSPCPRAIVELGLLGRTGPLAAKGAGR
jgi:hypothetical protein